MVTVSKTLMTIFFLGVVSLLSCGNNSSQPTDADKSIGTSGTDEEAYYNQGVAFSKQGKVGEAIKAWEKVIEVNPNFAKAHYNLGVAYRSQGQIEAAISAWQKTVLINPNDPKAHNNLGNAYINQGKLDEAIVMLNKAVAIDHNYGKAYFNLARVYAKKNQKEDCIDALKTALTRDALALEKAKNHRDFKELRQSPEFQQLIQTFESN